MPLLKDMIKIKNYPIEQAPSQLGVDAVVNAADPTLMGNKKSSPPTVDYALHKAVDDIHYYSGYLDDRIKEQFGECRDTPDGRLRCPRGKVVCTPGYGFCDTIFHTVGPRSDDQNCRPHVCSSTLIYTLESCYTNIIKEAVRNPRIKKIAVPIIAAGNFGVNYELAVKTAIATLYNTLLQMKAEDAEYFSYMNLEKIYLVIPDSEKCSQAKNILDSYGEAFGKERRVVSRTSQESLRELQKEVALNDEKRGYLTIAKAFRMILIFVRYYIFAPTFWLKETFGGVDWVRRRCVVERFTMGKAVLPVIWYFFLKQLPYLSVRCAVGFFSVYALMDTVTYLLALIILADIQRPSANRIRSMLMLGINYIEVSMDMAILYYVTSYGKVRILEAVTYGLIGEYAVKPYLIIRILNSSVNFFFLTMAFGYFSNHLRERRFRDLKAKCYGDWEEQG